MKLAHQHHQQCTIVQLPSCSALLWILSGPTRTTCEPCELSVLANCAAYWLSLALGLPVTSCSGITILAVEGNGSDATSELRCKPLFLRWRGCGAADAAGSSAHSFAAADSGSRGWLAQPELGSSTDEPTHSIPQSCPLCCFPLLFCNPLCFAQFCFFVFCFSCKGSSC